MIDDPSHALAEGECARLLGVLVEASNLRKVVLLTDDADVLGWAIALPSEIGEVTTADVLVSTISPSRVESG